MTVIPNAGHEAVYFTGRIGVHSAKCKGLNLIQATATRPR
jgi:hypothetical protein